MLNRINPMLLLFLALGALATSPSLQAQQNIIKDDWPMFADPVMPQEYKILVVTEKLIPTWLNALGSKDNEIRIDAVQTMRLAAQKELPGLEDDGVPSSRAPRLNISATLPRESREGPFVERKRTEK